MFAIIIKERLFQFYLFYIQEMAFLFKGKSKSPNELVKGLKELLSKLDGPEKKSTDKVLEEISKQLVSIKQMLYGEPDAEPNPELISQLAQEIYSNDLLELMVLHVAKLEFEARKDVAQVFNNLLRRQIGAKSPTVDYLVSREQILLSLVRGYENQDIALNCGMILRECLRHEALAAVILKSPNFYSFFDYVELSTFDIASDAFATFKDLLTKHKSLVADFLLKNYEDFVNRYVTLLQSNNYVTKRQSLKLLGELLLDRANFDIMTRFISNAEHMKLLMNLLRDKSRNIQFEAFHVFKVFVANPNKTKPILDILIKNQEKLISFLASFHNDRTDDEQFNDEKAFLIKQIEALQE